MVDPRIVLTGAMADLHVSIIANAHIIVVNHGDGLFSITKERQGATMSRVPYDDMPARVKLALSGKAVTCGCGYWPRNRERLCPACGRSTD